MCHQGGDCLEKSYQSAARQRFHKTWRRLLAPSPSTFPSHPNRSNPNSDFDTDDVFFFFFNASGPHKSYTQCAIFWLAIYPRLGGLIASHDGMQHRLRVAGTSIPARGACFVAAQLVALAGNVSGPVVRGQFVTIECELSINLIN